MTNEEYAIELAENISPYDIGGDNAAHYAAKDAAIEAMAWKDEQEIEFLQSLMFQASTQQSLNVIINNQIKLLKGE